MSRLNIFLLIVMLGCALSVVSATNQQRQFFIALQRAQSQQYALQQDYAQLQYQQSALSKTSRIEGIATADLKMQPVSSGRTQYLKVDPATAPAIDPPASGSAVSDAPTPATIPATTPARSGPEPSRGMSR
jgi:cell division protein FtsL